MGRLPDKDEGVHISRIGEGGMGLSIKEHNMMIDKNVSFREGDNDIFWVQQRADMSPEEIEASFYTNTEYSEIRKREKHLSWIFSQTGTVIGFGEDDLGVESIGTKTQRRRRRSDCCMNVLLEQMLQNETMGNDEQALADASVEFSSESTSLAYNRAYHVALQVDKECDYQQEMHVETESLTRPSSPTSTLDASVDCSPLDSKVDRVEFEPPSSSGLSRKQDPPGKLATLSSGPALMNGMSIYHSQPYHHDIFHSFTKPWGQWAHHVSEMGNSGTSPPRTHWYVAT